MKLIEEILFKIFDDGSKDRPDTERYPELRPWVLLLPELALKGPRTAERLPYLFKRALIESEEPHLLERGTQWQNFNKSIQLSLTDLWVRDIKEDK